MADSSKNKRKYLSVINMFASSQRLTTWVHYVKFENL